MIPVRINSRDDTPRQRPLIPTETIARVASLTDPGGFSSARSRSSHYELANLSSVTSNVTLHTLSSAALPRDEESDSFKPELFLSRPASPRVTLGGAADRVRLQTWEAGEAAEPLPEPRRIRAAAGSFAPSEDAPARFVADSRLGQESPSSPAAQAGTAAMHARLALADAASAMQLYANVMGPVGEAPPPLLPPRACDDSLRVASPDEREQVSRR